MTDGGNESIDILAASGLLHKKGKMGRNESKKRKSNWLSGDMERRKEKSSAARNDIKGIESWKYEEDQKINSSAMGLNQAIRKTQKDARTSEAIADRAYQRGRRHDEWDRNYDLGKTKKVKTHKIGLTQNKRGVGGYFSNSNRFDRANQAKTAAKKKGEVWESKAPTTDKNKKRKRKDVSKGKNGKKGKFTKTGQFRTNKLRMKKR